MMIAIAGQDGEDFWLTDIDDQNQLGNHPDQHGRNNGRLRLGVYPRQFLAERQCVVARHCEGQPDGRGMHGKRAHRHRHHDANQENLAQRTPHHLLDDVLQAAAAVTDLWISQIGRRHDREHENCSTDDKGGQYGPQDGARSGAPRLECLLAQ